VTLFLSESDVDELLSPEDAVDAVEASFRRLAAGAVENAPRRRLRLEDGRLADMAASDLELGYAGVKAYAGFSGGAAFVVALFSVDRP
jgi:ornithine cyclodeaminase/alanine dehydrogenase-like protein (mu-crystallin family)